MLTLGVGIALSAAQPTVGKSAKNKALPSLGITTPGIRVPAERLKSEAELTLSGEPQWLVFQQMLLAPDKTKGEIARIDPKTDKPAAPIAAVPGACGALINAFGHLWTGACGSNSILKIDPKTFKIAATVPAAVLPSYPSIAASADSIWVLSDTRSTLTRIDPEAGKIVSELRLPAGCSTLIHAESALWIACPSEEKVLRMDPKTTLISERIKVPAASSSMLFAEGSLWILAEKEGKILRIDPKTNKTTATIDLALPGLPGQLKFGEGYLWHTAPGAPLSRIDVASEKVLQQLIGEGGGTLEIGGGFLWLLDTKKGQLRKLDPKRILATLPD